MRLVIKHAIRMTAVIALGGFIGATLVRLAPGFGVDEEELDSRLNAASQDSLRLTEARNSNLAQFYVEYWKGLLHGDFGTSVALNESVGQLLAERVPETAKSVAAGLAVAWTFGLGLGLLSVFPPARGFAWAAWLLSSVILCIPAAALSVLFVVMGAPGRLAVGLIVFPKTFQFSRSLLKRSAAMPHVLGARARGLGETRILFRHVLPVCTSQLAALGGVSVCMALAACIPVEVLCDLPGIGQLAWKAAQSRDLGLLMNLTVLVTLVTLLANIGAELLAGVMRRAES